MHTVTINTCAEYLVAAYTAVAEALKADLGLSVQVDSKRAPTSFEELQRDAREHGVVFISEEHSASSIYGVAGNVAFRTVHDLGHLSTGLTWSTADEVALALHQWETLRLHIPVAWRERCQAVYQADTIMQSLYCERHGVFPLDQSEFIHAALAAYN